MEGHPGAVQGAENTLLPQCLSGCTHETETLQLKGASAFELVKEAHQHCTLVKLIRDCIIFC